VKTRLILLLLLIVCFSCGTNDKPLSDAQKEKIKGEVKTAVDAIFKGCEEANFDKAVESILNSSEFVYTYNGNSFGYKQFVDAIKPVFMTMSNQTVTITEEKYAILDHSTVVYSNNCKWLQNFKDGHTILIDPDAMLYIFKKQGDRWLLINGIESYTEKNLPSVSSKGFNQMELLNKFVGNWEIPLGKDAYEYVVIKSLQGANGLSVYAKWVTNGKMLFEGTGFWGFDKAINRIDISIMISTGDIIHDHGTFTSVNVMEFVNVNNAAAMKGVSKSTLEFITPDEIKETTTKDAKEEIVTWKRKK
jgi:hypothetical protein